MTCPIVLKVQPLQYPAFEPYGDIIQAGDAQSFTINSGTTQRFHDITRVDVSDKAGFPLINIYRSKAYTLPINITKMERHPLGSQTFVPLEPHPWLSVVAQADETGKPVVPEVFLVEPHQGVNYRKGIWHHTLIALEKTCDFLVIDRGGDGVNLEETDLSDEYLVENCRPEAGDA